MEPRIVSSLVLEYADNYRIQLTSIGYITDEDCLAVADLMGMDGYQKPYTIEYIRNWLSDHEYKITGYFRDKRYNMPHDTNVKGSRVVRVTEYLRSKGYSIPWRGLTTAQLVAYGWIEIKKNYNEELVNGSEERKIEKT